MPILTHINSTPIYYRHIAYIAYNVNLKQRAKALRQAGNFEEVVFWKQVHRKKFHGIDFNRQKIIGNYIADFYVVALGLVIEIDGGSHNDKEDYDIARDDFFLSLGIRIWRVSALKVQFDLDNVLLDLEGFIIKEFGKE